MKLKKGEFGYIKNNKKRNGMLAAICISIIFIASIIGRILLPEYMIYFAVGSAILILPAGQYITQFLLFARYTPGSLDYYKKYQEISDQFIILSDLIMVKGKKTIFVSFAIVTDEDIICCYQPNNAKASKNTMKSEQVKQILHEIIKPKGVPYHLELLDSEENIAEFLKKNIKGKLRDIDKMKQNKLATILLQSAV